MFKIRWKSVPELDAAELEVLHRSFGGEHVAEDPDYEIMIETLWVQNGSMFATGYEGPLDGTIKMFGYRYFKIGADWEYSYDYRGEEPKKVHRLDKFVPKTRFYVCVCPNYWGVALSVEAAKLECKRAGGTLNKYIVWKTPEGAAEVFCDSIDGTVCWKWLDGADMTGECKIVAYRGSGVLDGIPAIKIDLE